MKEKTSQTIGNTVIVTYNDVKLDREWYDNLDEEDIMHLETGASCEDEHNAYYTFLEEDKSKQGLSHILEGVIPVPYMDLTKGNISKAFDAFKDFKPRGLDIPLNDNAMQAIHESLKEKASEASLIKYDTVDNVLHNIIYEVCLTKRNFNGNIITLLTSPELYDLMMKELYDVKSLGYNLDFNRDKDYISFTYMNNTVKLMVNHLLGDMYGKVLEENILITK